MKSIALYHSVLSPTPSECRLIRRASTPFPAKNAVKIQENLTPLVSPFKARATVPHVHIAAVSSPGNGNLSVLLQTSAVLLVAYWIANFVVPWFIMEDFRKDKLGDNQDDPSED